MGEISSRGQTGDPGPVASPPHLGPAPHLDSSTRSKQPEPRHLTEAESIPPGFTRHDRKTHEEQEATSRYRTPAEDNATPATEVHQTIDEELGAENVTTIGEDWFAPPESEVAAAVNNLLKLTAVYLWTWTRPGKNAHTSSSMRRRLRRWAHTKKDRALPVTAEENRVLDTPGGFSRAPGDGRPPSGSPAGPSGRRITGRTKE